ncbi:phosphodiester glycosidase family protein [Rhizobium halophytocola]|uniref:phosphodiester glycosidase family protein n=1 Tax=Rhizobium halophytocola TaxID=735519 RepID=UPI0036094C22
MPLYLLAGLAGAGAAKAGDDASCRQVDRDEARFTVCSVDPGKDQIRLFNKGPDGNPYRSFSRLAQTLWGTREVLDFAVNGGMYEEDLGPVGLYVEYGIERHRANRRDGYGNFHLKPNGVFAVAGGKAVVAETGAYLASGFKADYATQSGPMLVIEGKIHPRFKADSDSLKIRNGVGVDAAGQVHLVLSERPIRFYDFATYFRDDLECPNALFLDGSISSLYAPSLDRHDGWFPLGPIIGVVRHLPD